VFLGRVSSVLDEAVLDQKLLLAASERTVAALPFLSPTLSHANAHSTPLDQRRWHTEPLNTIENRGDHLLNDAAAMLEGLPALDSEEEIATLGDRSLLPLAFVDEPRSAVVAQFGEAFTKALDDAQVGTWSGPVRSAYGAHLVFVTNRTGDRIPTFEEVRDRVELEWSANRRQRMNRDFLNALLAKYDVTVEWPGKGRLSEAQSASVSP